MTPGQAMMNGIWPNGGMMPPNWNRSTMQAQPQVPNYYNQQVQQTVQPDWNQYQYQMAVQQGYPSQPVQSQQAISQGLIGRQITDISDVTAIEVPMDGTKTYFPLADESSIYVKYWDRNGKLQEDRYVRQIDPNELVAVEGTKTVFPTVKEIDEAITPKLEFLNQRLIAIESMLAGVAMNSAPTGNSGFNSTPQQNARADRKPKKEES